MNSKGVEKGIRRKIKRVLIKKRSCDEHVIEDDPAPEEVGTNPNFVDSDDEHNFEEESGVEGNVNNQRRK